MWIPKKIGHMAIQLSKGHKVSKITVRELLRIFDAERRGFNKVQEIREALDQLGLTTEPDFESAWIDEPLQIRRNFELKPGPTEISQAPDPEHGDELGECEEGEDTSASPSTEQLSTDPESTDTKTEVRRELVAAPEGTVETILTQSTDPTFRIGGLAAANKGLMTVSQDDPLTRAITRMLQYDYSQLPIMHGDREVKGMITWRSIASRYSLGGPCAQVQHCREDAQVIDANGRLFDAIPTIVLHGYVLVRARDKKITGIITASDLSLQFQQLAEPFLLLREIELHIRHILQGKVFPEDFGRLASGDAPGNRPQSIADLSFGGYIRLLQRPEIWERLSLNIDQSSLIAQLDAVRRIRNDVMHFDPDPMTPKQLHDLTSAAKFMQHLYELLPSQTQPRAQNVA